jgi:hypothetical protein
MEMENFEMNAETITDIAITYGLQVALSVLALVAGLWIVKLIVGFMKSMLVRSEVDPSLQGFLTSLVAILLKVMVRDIRCCRSCCRLGTFRHSAKFRGRSDDFVL